MSNYCRSLLSLFLILCSCSEEIPNYSPQIMGNWAYIDDKGVYMELYIEKEYIRTYHEQFGDLFGRMEYAIVNDSLFFNQMHYRFYLQEDKTLRLSNNDYNLHLFRFYSIKQDSLNTINPFYLRRCNFLVNRGIISMREAIDYLNKHTPGPDEWKPDEESILQDMSH